MMLIIDHLVGDQRAIPEGHRQAVLSDVYEALTEFVPSGLRVVEVEGLEGLKDFLGDGHCGGLVGRPER
ncbi:hypothetical protein D3C84_1264600 [compost metagenome]